ncbi:MAG: pyridoxamine 5'-phosphate oxidase family protein [Chloroflexota bacterium]
MTTWADFAAAAPELAAFGAQRFANGVAYLATVTADGAPRVHPVTPIVGAGRLFLFMEPTSPKGHDLRRGSRYALHCAVSDSSGASGEFYVTGRATFVEDATTRALAVAASQYAPKDRYILFELSVERAAATVYENGEAVRRRWKAN